MRMYSLGVSPSTPLFAVKTSATHIELPCNFLNIKVGVGEVFLDEGIEFLDKLLVGLGGSYAHHADLGVLDKGFLEVFSVL